MHTGNVSHSIFADGHAIKWMFDSCITLGEYEIMRDVMSSVIIHWSSSLSLYPHILA